jgi:hypothetical protein
VFRIRQHYDDGGQAVIGPEKGVSVDLEIGSYVPISKGRRPAQRLTDPDTLIREQDLLLDRQLLKFDLSTS